MIQYNPADAVQCLPEGDYPAVLMDCTEKTSSKGNDMYELAFTVYAPDGREITVKEYVVMPTFTWKLKKLARAVGRLEEFEAGAFDPSACVGNNVTLTLTVQEQVGYEPKNQVKEYGASKPRAKHTKSAPSPVTNEDTADLPF